MGAWTPRSQRLGHNDYNGPYDGIPDHLRTQLHQLLYDMLSALKDPRRTCQMLGLRLRVQMDMSRQDVPMELVEHAFKDDDLCWDLIEGAVRMATASPWDHEKMQKRLRTLLDVAGSAYQLSEDLLIVERVGKQAQAVFDAAAAAADHTSEELREAWARAYGRNPDPSDAWDHAIKAVESILQPVVLPNDHKGTLGKIIAALSQGSHNFKSAFAGPDADNAVDKLVEALRLLWPNPDRHASGQPSRTPSLQEARAVVNLAAALVQCERDGYLVARR